MIDGRRFPFVSSLLEKKTTFSNLCCAGDQFWTCEANYCIRVGTVVPILKTWRRTTCSDRERSAIHKSASTGAPKSQV